MSLIKYNSVVLVSYESPILTKNLKSHSRSASCVCRLRTLPECYLFTASNRQARHRGAEAALWAPVGLDE